MADGFFNDEFFPEGFFQENFWQDVPIPEIPSTPPGFFHSNFFPRQFFQENLWQEYGSIEEFIEVLDGLGVGFDTMYDLKTGEVYPMQLRKFTRKPVYTELKDRELVFVVVGGVRRLVVRDGTVLRAAAFL